MEMTEVNGQPDAIIRVMANQEKLVRVQRAVQESLTRPTA